MIQSNLQWPLEEGVVGRDVRTVYLVMIDLIVIRCGPLDGLKIYSMWSFLELGPSDLSNRLGNVI